VKLGLVCSIIPLLIPIAPSNLGFEHAKLGFVFPALYYLKQVVPSIFDKFAPNQLWFFLVAYWIVPSCCSFWSFTHAHFVMLEVNVMLL